MTMTFSLSGANNLPPFYLIIPVTLQPKLTIVNAIVHCSSFIDTTAVKSIIKRKPVMQVLLSW